MPLHLFSGSCKDGIYSCSSQIKMTAGSGFTEVELELLSGADRVLLHLLPV